VTGNGTISIINKTTKDIKHLIRTHLLLLTGSADDIGGLSYRLPASFKNHAGRVITMYIPIKQPGETGPKPIIAKMEKTEKHLICAEFKLKSSC
jgi:hypothetical protein